jgi:hypothetical protein
MKTPARTALQAAVAASLGVAGSDAHASIYQPPLIAAVEYSNDSPSAQR